MAEQIDTLYWNHVRAEIEGGDLDDDEVGGGGQRTVVSRNTDLQLTSSVDQLPPSLEEVLVSTSPDPGQNPNNDEDDEGREELEEQYASLFSRLQSVSATRDAVRAKLQSYRRLREMLGPFEQAGENVQGNLVTRDGELGRELERMRGLLGRVEGLKRTGGEDMVVGNEDVEMAGDESMGVGDMDERNRRKVRDVLDVR